MGKLFWFDIQMIVRFNDIGLHTQMNVDPGIFFVQQFNFLAHGGDILSFHAIKQMSRALDRGLTHIAITDHGPGHL
ncbi:hypothetical protein P0G10_19675, partial [Eubacteriales bacterium DFI.9.88]|nr:hypothetical protein [Eubacteriales bacterium DFI.9.88]